MCGVSAEKNLLPRISIVNLTAKHIVSQLEEKCIQIRHCFSCQKQGSIYNVTNYELYIN